MVPSLLAQDYVMMT